MCFEHTFREYVHKKNNNKKADAAAKSQGNDKLIFFYLVCLQKILFRLTFLYAHLLKTTKNFGFDSI